MKSPHMDNPSIFYQPTALYPNINQRYKTNLCKSFMAGMSCHLGSRCHFAHGEHELRSSREPLPSNYLDQIHSQ